MPGISVLPNGQITYMGEPIEKYYIEGMDMLEGRYNLANDNISADDVSKVQILENHQPIRVLDSLVFTDRASLNIKLKNNVAVTGSAEIASGFSPLLFKTNLTPLLFSKKQQALMSYQYNNVGKDLLRDLNDFSKLNYLSISPELVSSNLLSIRGISPPPFSSKNWLDNSDHLGNLNYLYRLKDSTGIKINVAYLNSIQTKSGNRNTIYFNDESTFSFNEKINNLSRYNSIQSKLTIERNKRKRYFKSTLRINRAWDEELGMVNSNDTNINQILSKPRIDASNSLTFLTPMGKQLITINSKTQYTDSEQTLIVSPGQFKEVLNDNFDFQQSIQKLNKLILSSENSIGFTKKLNDFSISPVIGFSVLKEEINTNLSLIFQEDVNTTSNEIRNNLELFNANFFFTNRLQYNKNGFKANFTSPIILRKFRTTNNNTETEKCFQRLTFEPKIRLSKKLSSYWKLEMSGELENIYGDLNGTFNEFVLINYLNLVKNNSFLEERTLSRGSLALNYRNALKASFLSFAFSSSKNKSNILYNNSINDGGSLDIEGLNVINNITANSLNLSGSKSFNKVNTTTKFGIRYSIVERPQIINSNLVNFKTFGQRYNFQINTELFYGLSVSANTTLNFSKLESAMSRSNNIINWKNSMSTFVNFNDSSTFNVDFDQYFNNSDESTNSNYFINLSYQFTIRKYNLDLKVDWNNVLNTNHYVQAANSDFFSSQNSFIVRPAQILLALNFTL